MIHSLFMINSSGWVQQNLQLFSRLNLVHKHILTFTSQWKIFVFSFLFVYKFVIVYFIHVGFFFFWFCYFWFRFRDVFMEKHWKSPVARSLCDYFFDQQRKVLSPEDTPPVIATPHHYLISIYRCNMFFVAVCMTEGKQTLLFYFQISFFCFEFLSQFLFVLFFFTIVYLSLSFFVFISACLFFVYV